MTIVTKPITGDRKDKKDREALIPMEPEEPGKAAAAASAAPDAPDVVLPVTVRGHLTEDVTHYTVSACTQTVLMVLIVSALIVGTLGAFNAYKQMTEGHHYIRGFCRLPYTRSHEETLITGDFGSRPAALMRNFDDGGNLARDGDVVEPLKRVSQPGLFESLQVETRVNKNGALELDYELDVEMGEFEMLQLPEISHGRYLHDFKVNKTAIIDPDGGRCFVLPLNREEISPPRNLMDIISKLKNGAFELDLDEIRLDTKVILPPLSSFEGYGYFIERSCSQFTTYRLEQIEASRNLAKRSADGHVSLDGFVEFAGKSFIKYNIVNLDEINK